jgi:hypothetical protein
MRPRWLRIGGAIATLVALGAGAAWALSPDGTEGGWHALLHRPAFALRRIDFVGLRALDPEALRRMARLEPGIALVDVNPREVAGALARHPRISSARAARVPPGRLVVGIREREPLAVDAETLEGIDAGGARFPLEPAEIEALPRVRGDAAQALRVLAAARSLAVELGEVEADAETASAAPAGESVRLRLGGDPQRDLSNWLRLRASGLLARHQAREIDLRFEGSAVLRDFPTEHEEGTPDGSQR